jgi:hypothetical protein
VATIATEPCSVSPWVSLGNLVWSDVNNNGLKDASELGVTVGDTIVWDVQGAAVPSRRCGSRRSCPTCRGSIWPTRA